MSSLPQLGQDRWPGVADPPRAATAMSHPARSRRLWVRVLASTALLAIALSALAWLRSSVVVSPEGYLPSAAGSSVTVLLTTGSGDVVVDASAQETVNQVEVLVKIRSPRGSRVAIGIPVEVTIPLQQPLGDRTVVDGRTGNVLAEVERQP